MKAAVTLAQGAGRATPRKAIRGRLTGAWATAASGQATAAPPRAKMNSRRLTFALPRNSIRKPFGINGVLVSWIRVRSAHGSSFDHLVGAGKQRRRHVEA